MRKFENWRKRIIRLFSLASAICLLYLTAEQYAQGDFLWLLGLAHATLLFGRPKLLMSKNLLGQLLVGFIAALAFQLHSWALVTWICMLAGIGISRAMAGLGSLRSIANILLVFFLLCVLFFTVLPNAILLNTASQEIFNRVELILFICWLIAELCAIAEPAEDEVEPVISALFILCCGILALATALARFQLPHYAYETVMILVVASGACAMLAIWILWCTNLVGGLAKVFFRHVLSLGIPIDEWIQVMTNMANKTADVELFWSSAMNELLDMTDLVGISWQHNEQEQLVGSRGKYLSYLPLPGQRLTLHTRRLLLPTKSFSYWILVRVSHEFRLSKEREARHATEARLRSIHELGARTTHDLKNLLHAINLICSSLHTNSQQEASLSTQKREQLQLLAARLETTLSRLKGDSKLETAGGKVTADAWWKNAQRNYASENITFTATTGIKWDSEIPSELFDRALENMLHNALRKQAKEGHLDICVTFGPGAYAIGTR